MNTYCFCCFFWDSMNLNLDLGIHVLGYHGCCLVKISLDRLYQYSKPQLFHASTDRYSTELDTYSFVVRLINLYAIMPRNRHSHLGDHFHNFVAYHYDTSCFSCCPLKPCFHVGFGCCVVMVCQWKLLNHSDSYQFFGQIN